MTLEFTNKYFSITNIDQNEIKKDLDQIINDHDEIDLNIDINEYHNDRIKLISGKILDVVIPNASVIKKFYHEVIIARIDKMILKIQQESQENSLDQDSKLNDIISISKRIYYLSLIKDRINEILEKIDSNDMNILIPLFNKTIFNFKNQEHIIDIIFTDMIELMIKYHIDSMKMIDYLIMMVPQSINQIEGDLL